MTSVAGSDAWPMCRHDVTDPGFDTRTWVSLTTVLEGGHHAFDRSYQGFHAFFGATAFPGATNPDTTLVDEGPQNCCTSPSDGFDHSGTTSVLLASGDTFGFRFGGRTGDTDDSSNGTLAMSQVPLPAGPRLPAPGCAGLGLAGFRGWS